MKKKLTKEYKLRRIAHWRWLMREYPSCEQIQQTGRYIIRKYTDAP